MTSPSVRRRRLLLALTLFFLVVGGIAVVTIDGDDKKTPTQPLPGNGLPPFVRDPERRALVPAFESAARAEDLPVALLEGLAWRESQWDADAVNEQSGAIGIGQLLPETASFVATQVLHDPSLDPKDARDNIRLTAAYLRALIDRFGGDEQTGLAAYLQGSTSVADDGVSAQTAAYVEQVMTLRRAFADARAEAGR